jgi:hypothetical protein
MKAISRIPYAVGVCAAAAILAGCGSAQSSNPSAQSFNPSAQTAGRDSSSAENLIGTANLGACHSHYVHHGHGQVITGEAFRVDFHAHGQATGPSAGTFVASGSWRYTLQFVGSGDVEFWNLAEKFTIKSGASKIVGTIQGDGAGGSTTPGLPTCTSFGPETLPYDSGSASINIIQEGKFNETLDAM